MGHAYNLSLSSKYGMFRVILPVDIQLTIPIIISSHLSLFYDLIVYVNEGNLL